MAESILEEREDIPFLRFAKKAEGMPSVIEKILKNLSIFDIANCLKASRDFKRLIESTFQWRNRLKIDLETEASRINCTSREWQVIKSGELKIQTGFNMDNSFGVGHYFWLAKRSLESYRYNGQHYIHVFLVFDLNTAKMTKSIEAKVKHPAHIPGVKILPGSELLLGDAEQIRLMSWDGEQLWYWNQPVANGMLRLRHFYCDDSITSQSVDARNTKHPFTYTFYSGNSKSGMASQSFRLPDGMNPDQCKILQEGQLVLIYDYDRMVMFDLTNSKKLWERKDLGYGELTCSEMLLTEIFCGFFYCKITSQDRRTGAIMLLLFNPASGQLLCEMECWTYVDRVIQQQFFPRLIANGSFIFALHQHYDIICFKVNANGSCKIHLTGVGITDVLRANYTSYKSCSCKRQLGMSVDNSPNSFGLFGFAFETVVIGFAGIQYTCHNKNGNMNHTYKMLFSLDIEAILSNHPCLSNVMKAVHLPLGHGNIKPLADFYPYYQNANYEKETKLAGVVEVLERKGKILFKVHSFTWDLEKPETIPLKEDLFGSNMELTRNVEGNVADAVLSKVKKFFGRT